MLRHWTWRAIWRNVSSITKNRPFYTHSLPRARERSTPPHDYPGKLARTAVKTTLNNLSPTRCDQATNFDGKGNLGLLNKSDATYILRRLEPTLSAHAPHEHVTPRKLPSHRAGRLAKASNYSHWRYIPENAKTKAQELRGPEGPRVDTSGINAYDGARRRGTLSSVLRFDHERGLLCATAVRRPLRIDKAGPGANDEQMNGSKTTTSDDITSDRTLLSGQPRRTRLKRMTRLRLLERPIRAKSFLLRQGEQWAQAKMRQARIRPRRGVQNSKRGSNDTIAPVQSEVDALFGHHVASRRRRSVYLLRITPNATQSNTKSTSGSVRSNASLRKIVGSEHAVDPQSTAPKISPDEFNLEDAIDDLTHAEPKLPVVVRHVEGRSEPREELLRWRQRR